MRHQVLVAQLRTLSIEIEADSSKEAERLVRRALAGRAYADEWLTRGTEVSVAQLGPRDGPASGATQQRELLGLSGAAEFLGISRTTLYGVLQAGELRSVRIGRRRFVARSHLHEYLSSRTEAG